MAWTKMDTTLFRNRKLKRLARLLKLDIPHAMGHLAMLWANVLDMADDGDISKWSKEDIAEYAGWSGDPALFYSAMVNGGDGFIDERDGRLIIHDWWTYAGAFLTSRYQKNKPRLEQIKNLYGNNQHQCGINAASLQHSSDKIREDIYKHTSYVGRSSQGQTVPSAVVFHYINAKGLNKNDLSRSDMGRLYKASHSLLERAKGDIKIVLAAITWVSKQKYVDWTLETVDKKWADYMKQYYKPESNWDRMVREKREKQNATRAKQHTAEGDRQGQEDTGGSPQP